MQTPAAKQMWAPAVPDGSDLCLKYERLPLLLASLEIALFCFYLERGGSPQIRHCHAKELIAISGHLASSELQQVFNYCLLPLRLLSAANPPPRGCATALGQSLPVSLWRSNP